MDPGQASGRTTVAATALKLTVVAYDRRGYRQTPPSTGPFSHLDDLLAVIGHAGAGPVWLAGASAGGGLALDAALVAPTGSRAWW